jgi:hypothetical protein
MSPSWVNVAVSDAAADTVIDPVRFAGGVVVVDAVEPPQAARVRAMTPSPTTRRCGRRNVRGAEFMLVGPP